MHVGREECDQTVDLLDCDSVKMRGGFVRFFRASISTCGIFALACEDGAQTCIGGGIVALHQEKDRASDAGGVSVGILLKLWMTSSESSCELMLLVNI